MLVITFYDALAWAAEATHLVVTHLWWKRKDLISDPWHHTPAKHNLWTWPWVGDQLPGAHWPDNLSNWGGSRFSEWPCLKIKVECERGGHWCHPLASTCTVQHSSCSTHFNSGIKHSSTAEHLLSMPKVLGLILCTKKKKKDKQWLALSIVTSF